MSVWFLDDDAEITEAVARLRSTEDELVVLVVPPGSRIATGRINFRLLAREASARGLRLAVASPDEQVRSLAAAAGVLARGSPEEAEAALEAGETPPAEARTTVTRPAPDPRDAAVAAPSVEELHERALDDTGAGASVGLAGAAAAARARYLTRRRIALTTSAVVTLGLIGGAAAFQALPTATISLRPVTTAVGPILVSVTASVSTEAIDEATGEIPAEAVPIPLSVSGTFPATGREALESRAVGEVVFSSAEQAFAQPISARTRVLTDEGVEFQTTEDVVLRPPPGGPGAAEVRAPIEAVRSGEQGNVPAGSIVVVPSLEMQGIAVTNPEATSGGEREESPVVTQDDYDAAATDLSNRLAGELAARLREPESVPEGLTLFPETARIGEVEHSPPAAELVGRAVAEFELSASASAQVIAVDGTLVEQVAIARLAGQAPAGMALIPESVRTEAGTGAARGDVVNYAASAEGEAALVVDADEVIERVRGLPVSDARSILEPYGSAEVAVWPEFVGAIPDDAARISLEIEEPWSAQ